MSAAKTKNVAASIRQRLLNLAHASKEPFDLVLVRYALERLLYRLSVSEFRDRFVLKGALLFTLWGHSNHRPTRDADLLGFGPGDPAKRFRQEVAIGNRRPDAARHAGCNLGSRDACRRRHSRREVL